MRKQQIILFVLACCFFSSAPAEEERLARSTVEALIRDQLNSWSLEDEEMFLSTVHPEIIFAYPGARLDEEGALKLFRYWAQNYSDTRVYFHNIIVEGNDFSVEYQFATTRDNDGSRSATGTVTTGQVKDGKLILWKEYLDGRVTGMQRDGELPVDEGEPPFPWPLKSKP
jgi:hypothetical protein